MNRRLVFVLLPFLLLSAAESDAVVIDKIAVIINDSVITQSELDAMDQLDLHLSGLPSRDSVLQQRIDFHLALQQLKEQPPVLITEEEVQEAFESYELRIGGTEELNEFLAKIGLTRDDLLQEIRNQLSIRKFIRDRFRPFVNITIQDAEDYYEKVYKPAGEMLAKEVPPFAEIFSEIQNLLVDSGIQEQIVKWLQELRAEARINIKD